MTWAEGIVAAIGWGGAGLLLTAYAMASTERISAGGRAFQLLNLFGAAALTVNSGYHQAWPSALLNTAWIGIGLAALTRRPPRVP
ncbi:CBU_0592 family membrane protein [Streptomyces europaeiscabiei]|uniref:CBU_0592 family membrane protein n=1 Tax=Streptomyces europaeiscabiei TaxID=146819 RepID=UPI0038F720C1